MALASKPLKPQNAIESATFVVAFAQGLAKPILDRIQNSLRSLSIELPGEGKGVAPIQFGNSKATSIGIEVMEVSRFFANPNGTPQWSVQAIGNLIQVQCFEYTKFTEVWARARKYLLCALEGVEPDMLVNEVGFQVVDRFEYPAGSAWSDYKMGELFDIESKYLTKNSWNNDALWHVFQGWFEPYAEGRVLHQLNVSNTITLANQQLCAVIDHRGTLRGKTDAERIELKFLLKSVENGRVELDNIIQYLHDRNCDVIEDLLNSDKLKSIGIEKGSRSASYHA